MLKSLDITHLSKEERRRELFKMFKLLKRRKKNEQKKNRGSEQRA